MVLMRPCNKVSLLLHNNGTSVPAYDSLLRLLTVQEDTVGGETNAQGQRLVVPPAEPIASRCRVVIRLEIKEPPPPPSRRLDACFSAVLK
jgi:hypothetical protein